MSSRMNRMGKSEVYFGRVIPLAEVLSAINAVTLDDMKRIAETIFPEDPEVLTVAAVGPFDGVSAEEEAAAAVVEA
jgi:predicted Zn-dependent peptidase